MADITLDHDEVAALYDALRPYIEEAISDEFTRRNGSVAADSDPDDPAMCEVVGARRILGWLNHHRILNSEHGEWDRDQLEELLAAWVRGE